MAAKKARARLRSSRTLHSAPVADDVSTPSGADAEEEPKGSNKRPIATNYATSAAKRARVSPSTSAEGSEEGEELPQEVLSAVERKRMTNTLSARRCRARKLERVRQLEGENERLRKRVEELEAQARAKGLLY